MMENKFTDKEINDIKDIISDYREISSKLSSAQKEAEEIKNRVESLKKSMDDIKSKEDFLMDELHKKYGDFSLQDVYNIINGL